ncbi:metallopeptidase TldD-related protein [Angustibacter sp. McL0619]|uniref:metallopeptidase TldD-related protein n=1 Tax=Angustibacter sp. McL0619 TaxID=3415676 RepID=UPI003CEB7B9B
MSAHPAELAERALAAATNPCLVLVGSSAQANLRWAANTLTTNGITSGQDVTIISVHGGDRVAIVSRSGVDATSVVGLVAEAEAAARASSPAEDASELVQGGADDSFGDLPAEIGAADLAALAERLGAAMQDARDGERELFGYAEQTVHTTYLASSTGLRARHAQPSAAVQLNGKSHQRSRSAWAGAAARALAEVDVAALADEVSERLAWQARRVELDAGRYDTVLPPSAVADLMTYACWSSDARSAHEGRSVFGRKGGGTRLGDRLSGRKVRLFSDPHAPGLESAPLVLTGGSSPFASVFDNGLPVTAQSWIQDGTLAALPTTRHTAALAGIPDTQLTDNLLMEVEGGQGSSLDLVAGLEDGLLMTCLWYIREVDPQTLLLTGLTRDGVYKVENGEVVGAVTNYRFNESPVDLLDRIEAAGSTVRTLGREFGDYLPRVAMPALRVRGFNCSSVSQAS